MKTEMHQVLRPPSLKRSKIPSFESLLWIHRSLSLGLLAKEVENLNFVLSLLWFCME
jgi:hypothetical protein